jgi:hypothetical protein
VVQNQKISLDYLRTIISLFEMKFPILFSFALSTLTLAAPAFNDQSHFSSALDFAAQTISKVGSDDGGIHTTTRWDWINCGESVASR